MTAAERELIEALRGAKAFLAVPGNEFSWSEWPNAETALREFDGLIADIESGKLPDRMKISLLFAPTGSVQEVSLSSGWGDEFIALAKRFDAAESRVYDTFGTRLRSWLGFK